MEFPEERANSSPPDLLKRFVPTPFRTELQIGRTRVVVKTNDPGIPLLLRDFKTRSRFRPVRQFRWKLARDDSVQVSTSQAVLLRHGPLAVLSMGPACLIGADYENNELFAFLGAFASGDVFSTSVLGELTGKACPERMQKRKAMSGRRRVDGFSE